MLQTSVSCVKWPTTHLIPTNVPFCQIVSGIDHDHTSAADIVLCNESVVAFVSSHWWLLNKGHVLVIPTYFENIYTLPDELGAQGHVASRLIAIAMKKGVEMRLTADGGAKPCLE
jgi:diadenosine tetraphosphate (Ap4A) HIT family hydrolase